ncbi:DNA-binding XRE family transcriptional regulator [Saccharopolyspora lacisalsi]|uniref:DNA-binding XRE family transcriptional regulator n=1 Tax=Halosaccharopolyspora lacisalsi TaxID=1000566 RepID=A0A839E967_9PSEU|nr:helix-turn-helix transcriptional regulator [Halosaccharopolyspora lacisalsi]MBA8827811.1 DNA-binding XRE family transcriptional regulator [Halosaccharopolyspora lacisalsi]
MAEHASNTRLVALRERAGLSQDELARALSDLAGGSVAVTKKTIGRWERGDVACPVPLYRRLLATFFGCAPGELGFTDPAGGDEHPHSGEASAVAVDQHRWCRTRAALAGRRHALAAAAARFYATDYTVPGADGSGAITTSAWIPPTPVELSAMRIAYEPEAPAPSIDGSEPPSIGVRPAHAATTPYRRYSHAIRDLAMPRLFENRLCFRLTGIDWNTQSLRFSTMGFYDGVDINEGLAHELAAAEAPSTETEHPHLPFRSHVGDPFALSRRAVLGAIGTLTIRGGTAPSMVLHHRDSHRVAGGGSLLHLMPAGLFQPSSVHPQALDQDFSLWRNIQREAVEELLGDTTCGGDGSPIDYEQEPFAGMERARARGQIRVYCLGVTLDALTLAADILTVAVIAPEVYDDLFAVTVTANDEGHIPTCRVPFGPDSLTHARSLGAVSPGATAAIGLAQQHRERLLDESPPSRPVE